MSRKKGNPTHIWNNQEIRRLELEYPITPSKELSEKMNIPLKVLVAKATSLKIRKDKDFLSKHLSEVHLKRWRDIESECI
jgi:hypothetical protein